MNEDEEVERLMQALGIAVTAPMRAPTEEQMRAALAERVAAVIRWSDVAAVSVDVASGAITVARTPAPHLAQAHLTQAFASGEA